MIVIGLAAALFTIMLAGFGVTMSLFARAGRVNLIECACLSWLLGGGIISLLMWLAGAFCSGLVLQAIVTALGLALAIFGWRAMRRANAKFDVPGPATISEWILAGIVFVEIAALILVSFKHTLGWDGLLNWEIKARYAFGNDGVIPLKYYSSAGRAFSHPQYPLGIPLTETWLYLWMGEPNQFWVKTIFPLYYAACAPLLALAVSRLSGKRWVGLLIAAFLPLVPYILNGPGGVIVGYVDFPIAVIYVVALGYMLLAYKGEPAGWLVFGAILALLPWLKTEGTILYAVLAALGVVAGWRIKQFKSALLAAVPGLFIIIAWKGWLKLIHVRDIADFNRPNLDSLFGHLDRLPAIAQLLWTEVGGRGHWSIFWLLFVVAVIQLLVTRRPGGLILTTAICAPIFIELCAYVFSAWSSYTAHVTSSLPRLVLQMIPAGWLAIGLALSRVKREAPTL